MKVFFYLFLCLNLKIVGSGENNPGVPPAIPIIEVSDKSGLNSNNNGNITFSRGLLYIIAAADAGTEARNMVYEKEDVFSKANIAKIVLFTTLLNGRDVNWLDVGIYSAIVISQSLLNYNNKKGSLLAVQKKIIEHHEEQKKQLEKVSEEK